MQGLRQTTLKSMHSATRRVVTPIQMQGQKRALRLPTYRIHHPMRAWGIKANTQLNTSHIQTRRVTTLLGSGAMSTFIKSSYLFWGIPISAVISPYVNTLPLDAFFGTLLPYHAYIGLHHIFTDYFPAFAVLSYVAAGVMFIGIQNSNFNGEGISKSVRRLFVSSPMPVEKKDK